MTVSVYIDHKNQGEWDDYTHLVTGRYTWCRKSWPAHCRVDGRGLRRLTRPGENPTCPDCLAEMAAHKLMSEP